MSPTSRFLALAVPVRVQAWWELGGLGAAGVLIDAIRMRLAPALELHFLNAILLVSPGALRQGEHFCSSLELLATDRHGQERREILASLAALGVLTLDSISQELPVALANRYLDSKAAGRI